MSEKLEVVVFKSNIEPIRAREVYWLITKNQLEHVAQEIEINPIPFAQKYIFGLTAWQGLVLPVISLESFFKFKPHHKITSSRKVVVKTAVQGDDGLAARLMLDVPFDVKVRSLESEECSPAGISQKELEARGLRGVYEWEQDKLLLVPDLDRIARGSRQN